jgi:predicted metal-dependent hydrolase
MKERRVYKREQAQTRQVTTPTGIIEYDLFRSPRRRTMELSLYEGGRLRAVAPNYVSEERIRSFVLERAAWVRQRLKEADERNAFINSRKYQTGHEFLFLGRHYPLSVQRQGIKRVKVLFDESGWLITIPLEEQIKGGESVIKDQLVSWYRSQALEVFGGRVFFFARRMGMEPWKVSVRAQKQVWGMCHHTDRRISLNWKLIMAPMDVIDYVVVHELAHLKHPNHSRKFWSFVESILPDYTIAEDWLKHHRLEMVLP